MIYVNNLYNNQIMDNSDIDTIDSSNLFQQQLQLAGSQFSNLVPIHSYLKVSSKRTMLILKSLQKLSNQQESYVQCTNKYNGITNEQLEKILTVFYNYFGRYQLIQNELRTVFKQQVQKIFKVAKLRQIYQQCGIDLQQQNVIVQDQNVLMYQRSPQIIKIINTAICQNPLANITRRVLLTIQSPIQLRFIEEKALVLVKDIIKNKKNKVIQKIYRLYIMYFKMRQKFSSQQFTILLKNQLQDVLLSAIKKVYFVIMPDEIYGFNNKDQIIVNLYQIMSQIQANYQIKIDEGNKQCIEKIQKLYIIYIVIVVLHELGHQVLRCKDQKSTIDQSFEFDCNKIHEHDRIEFKTYMLKMLKNIQQYKKLKSSHIFLNKPKQQFPMQLLKIANQHEKFYQQNLLCYGYINFEQSCKKYLEALFTCVTIQIKEAIVPKIINPNVYNKYLKIFNQQIHNQNNKIYKLLCKINYMIMGLTEVKNMFGNSQKMQQKKEKISYCLRQILFAHLKPNLLNFLSSYQLQYKSYLNNVTDRNKGIFNQIFQLKIRQKKQFYDNNKSIMNQKSILQLIKQNINNKINQQDLDKFALIHQLFRIKTETQLQFILSKTNEDELMVLQKFINNSRFNQVLNLIYQKRLLLNFYKNVPNQFLKQSQNQLQFGWIVQQSIFPRLRKDKDQMYISEKDYNEIKNMSEGTSYQFNTIGLHSDSTHKVKMRQGQKSSPNQYSLQLKGYWDCSLKNNQTQ